MGAKYGKEGQCAQAAGEAKVNSAIGFARNVDVPTHTSSML